MVAVPPDPTPLLAAYDLAPPVTIFALPSVGTNNRVAGVRTGAGDFVWKLYQTFDDPAPLHYEARLLTWLAGLGLPFAVPAPLPDRAGDAISRAGDGWQALSPLLPGDRPDPRDPVQVVAIGAALGELHRALEPYSRETRPNAPAFGDLDRLHPAIPSPEALTPEVFGLPGDPPRDRALAWWREHLAGLRAFIAGPYAALPRQPIHGDFAPSNTLYHDGRLSAILDFEFAAPDARALDLASGLEYTLRYWEGTPPEELWPIASAFCRGYARRNRLTDAEIDAIPQLMLLRDTVSTLWHTGRALASGQGARNRAGFEHLWDTTHWLATHERDLVATIHLAFDPPEANRAQSAEADFVAEGR